MSCTKINESETETENGTSTKWTFTFQDEDKKNTITYKTDYKQSFHIGQTIDVLLTSDQTKLDEFVEPTEKEKNCANCHDFISDIACGSDPDRIPEEQEKGYCEDWKEEKGEIEEEMGTCAECGVQKPIGRGDNFVEDPRPGKDDQSVCEDCHDKLAGDKLSEKNKKFEGPMENPGCRYFYKGGLCANSTVTSPLCCGPEACGITPEEMDNEHEKSELDKPKQKKQPKVRKVAEVKGPLMQITIGTDVEKEKEKFRECQYQPGKQCWSKNKCEDCPVPKEKGSPGTPSKEKEERSDDELLEDAQKKLDEIQNDGVAEHLKKEYGMGLFFDYQTTKKGEKVVHKITVKQIGGGWGTFWMNEKTGGYHRIKSKNLPMRDTMEEACKDLYNFVSTNKLKPTGWTGFDKGPGGEKGQGSASEFNVDDTDEPEKLAPKYKEGQLLIKKNAMDKKLLGGLFGPVHVDKNMTEGFLFAHAKSMKAPEKPSEATAFEDQLYQLTGIYWKYIQGTTFNAIKESINATEEVPDQEGN